MYNKTHTLVHNCLFAGLYLYNDSFAYITKHILKQQYNIPSYYSITYTRTTV